MQNLIPIPESISPAEGVFDLTKDSRIHVAADTDEMYHLGQHLSEQLLRSTGKSLAVSMAGEPPSKGSFYLTTQGENVGLGTEGYELLVTASGVQISAPQPAGVFYGIQTLSQLLPSNVEGNISQSGYWSIPAVRIRDRPRFSWRGTMVDVARHFFDVEDVKDYIDVLASYKLNILHLHLTDDQGWRLEIRSWPKLAVYGGETAAGGDPGGFYTQAQYVDLIDYARQRYITIVPEIDMPGHTNAALASYPELNCDGKAPQRYMGMEVGFSSLCTEKEVTYRFVNDVLTEVAGMTPGPYIHIGGDEAHNTLESNYMEFIERIDPMITALGKEMVGWEEIAQCNLSKSAIVQYWKDLTYARLAEEKGKRLILSPGSKTYLDMKYQEDTPLGQNWAGMIDVEKSYRWDPATELSGLQEQAILGVEAPLWTETLRTMGDVQFMAFPRLLGIAEIAWSSAQNRDWESYRQRLAEHGQRMRSMGVNFYPDPKIHWT